MHRITDRTNTYARYPSRWIRNRPQPRVPAERIRARITRGIKRLGVNRQDSRETRCRIHYKIN